MATQIASAKKLIINKLTQAQYDSIPEKDPAQLYLITDAEVSGGASGFTKEEADGFYVSKDESGAAVFDIISRTQGQITVPNKAGTLALLSDLEGLSGGEGVIIPSQENNSGKFLTTDGNNLSWANALKNNAKDTEEYGSVAIGGGATCEGGGVCIGQGSDCRNGVAIGNYTYSTASEAIAIGLGANATADGAIQIGFGTNSEANTFSVGLGSTPYKMLGSDGVIPSERLASDGATGQVLTKTASGMEWQNASGGAAGDYLPLSGGTLSGPVIVEMEDNGQTFIGSKTNFGTSIGFRGGTYIETKSASDEVFVRLDITNEGVACLNEQIPLGKSTNPWSNVFTPKLNNGADIAVPTEGGTLARIEDIDATVGDISTVLTAILGE